jgi:hypothetical protein
MKRAISRSVGDERVEMGGANVGGCRDATAHCGLPQRTLSRNGVSWPIVPMLWGNPNLRVYA